MESTKTCTKCDLIKPLEEFGKHKSRKSGIRDICKACTNKAGKQYKLRNKEKIEKQRKQYRIENKEIITGYMKQYRTDNKLKIKGTKQQYNADNKEKIKEHVGKYQKQYYMTLAGWVAKKWHGLNQRTVNGTHPKYKNKNALSYLAKIMPDGTIGVRLEFTRDEFAKWATDNWHIAELIIASGQRPSLDRIKSDEHYTLQNIQIISWKENSRRAGIETQARKKQLKLAEALLVA